MNDYIYIVKVRGQVFSGKITALNFVDFINQIETLYGNFNYLEYTIKGV